MEPGTAPAAAAAAAPSDIRLCGYLRKQKSHRRRYFVLRSASERGPARLEYYESEKKFRASGGVGGVGAAPRPKRTFPLASALNINKRADARHPHLIVLYAHQGTFGLAAEDAEQQQVWYAALVELHCKGKEAASEGSPGPAAPNPAFKEVWQVSLRPRGLGHSRNLAGTYLLCLAEKTISFVKLNSAVVAVVLQLLNVRRCGHSENYFFMEVGRSAVTGPGELWMQVEDLVVAQNMHETILEAMRALSEDVRLRSKSQSLASTPIAVPSHRQSLSPPPAGRGSFSWRPPLEGTPSLSRRPAGLGQKAPGARKPDSLSDYSAISSDEGGSSPGESRLAGTPDPLNYTVEEVELDYIAMGKLASPEGHPLTWGSAAGTNKRASLPPLALGKDTLPLPCSRKQGLKSVAVSASYPEGLNLRRVADPGYMAMLPGVVATGAEDQDYVPMTPGSVSPPRGNGGYMVMSPTGSGSLEGPGPWRTAGGETRSLGDDYMNMSPVSQSASSSPPEYGSALLALPRNGLFYSLPRSYRHDPRPLALPFNAGRLSCSSSTSSESLEEPPGAPARPRRRLFLGFPRDGQGDPPFAPQSSPGEYVSIDYRARATDYVNMELGAAPAESSRTAVPESYAEMVPGARRGRGCPSGRHHPSSETFAEGERSGGALPCETQAESGLNYIDLDLGKEATPETASASHLAGQAGRLHTYASIDFDRSGELWGYRASSEGEES
uniref:Insulin receptor substrate 1-like isoform X2 n=1 Tax=Pogona vitticeps TaxID=103695 RepID=A0ABM5EJP4_9SAUR